MEKRKGDEPETAKKDEETAETPDHTTTAQPQPAQVEEPQPVQTTQSPERAGQPQDTCGGDVNDAKDGVVVSAETEQGGQQLSADEESTGEKAEQRKEGEDKPKKKQVGEGLPESGRGDLVDNVVCGDSAETADKPSSGDLHQDKTEPGDSYTCGKKPDPQSEQSQEQAGAPSSEADPESKEPAGSGANPVKPSDSETSAPVQTDSGQPGGLGDSDHGSGPVTKRSEAAQNSAEATGEVGRPEAEAAGAHHSVAAQDSSDPKAQEAAGDASDLARDSLPKPVSSEAEVSPEPVSDPKEPEPDKPGGPETEPAAKREDTESAELSPSEDRGAAQLKSGDAEQVETSHPDAADAERSTETPEDSTEQDGAETEKGHKDTASDTPEPVESAAEPQAAHRDLTEDTAPAAPSSEATPTAEDESRKLAGEESRSAELQAKDSQDQEAEQPQEQQSELEGEGKLRQTSSLIVQESIAKAFKALSEHPDISPSEGAQVAESETTEPESAAKPAEPSETAAASEKQDPANGGVEGSAEDPNLDPTGPVESSDKGGEESADGSQAASEEAASVETDTFSSLSSASSESLERTDRGGRSPQQQPEGKALSDLKGSTVVDPEFSVGDNLQQTQTGDTDRDKPGDTVDSALAEAEKHTEPATSDVVVHETVQQEERDSNRDKPGETVDPTPTDAEKQTESAALDLAQESVEQGETDEPTPRPVGAHAKARPASGSSSTSSLSSTDSADASAVARRRKKRSRPRAGFTERKVTFRSPEPQSTANKMGAGASSQGDMEDLDPRYAAQSTAAMSHADSPPRSPVRSKQPMMSQHSSMKSSGHMSMARASRFNMDGYEDAEVRISSDGFSIQEVTIMEGQMVRFVCDQSAPSSAILLQVVYDGEELRPVIGGYQVPMDDHHGVVQQQLNLEGEYKFALSGFRCTPLLVRVRRKTDLLAEVTDDGFMPDTIYIDQGTSIRWQWKQTSVPHTVSEVSYVFDKGCLSRQTAVQSMVATTTGTYRQTFNRPGLYYLRTEGSEPGRTHLCIVCVQSVSREYRVEILDRSFQPMILLIEEGDRVWFSWDRFKCKKAHSVYQIEPPTMEHNEDDAYEPARDGFKWATPSKHGLMSHRFDKVGVFYFSDQNFEEAAEYIGTIIVKPKQREHVVKLQENGFTPDLLRVMTGERVWWLWDGPAISDMGEGLLMLEEDKVLNPLSRKNQPAEQSEHYQDLDAASAQLMTRVGAATIHFTTVGVYTYKVSDVSDSFNSCSVIVNPGSKNHTVHLTDNGFEPKVITVNCNDRVWWVWQSGKRQHNVVQVSHQGLPIPGGFCSGQPRDSPSAFAYQFSTPGVYYFISKSLPQVFGAVVVSTRPQVHEVSVRESELKPDPVTIQLNDVVAWVFGAPRQFDVSLVATVDQILDTARSQKALAPRRCFARGISQPGNYHFKSKSFQKRKEMNYKEGAPELEETRLSSVVCDDRCDSIIVQLDKKGFHPNSVFLQKGQSLLWSWKGTDEEHNVIHVTDPQSAAPLNMIKGPKAFNSGRPLPNDSFLYTFDESGSYTVVSQGAPGYSCTVNVLDVAQRTGEPFILQPVASTVDRYSKIYLASKTPSAKIYYTLDGSRPSVNSKLYRPEKGVTLRESGLHFVRAVAVADQYLQSHIFTSKRLWVLLKGDGDHKSESSLSDQEMTVPPQTKTWDWWSCKPTIKGCFTSPGTLEIFWDPPNSAVKKQIKSYQIFLNGVSYCQKFPSSTNSLKLVGLAGGRKYNVCIEVYPQHSKNQIIESNTLQLTCPKVAPPGGPVISLETNADPHTLSVVWMSIDSSQQPIDGYLVYLNDQQCGPKLVPESGSNRCKVVISGCDTAIDYKLYVLAVSADTDETRMSNVLVVQLPLDTSNVTLPPPSERVADEEVYMEYIEVLEGSGYLPQMDEPKSKRAALQKVLSSSSSTESETDSETDSETGSSETESETESETDSDKLPQSRQLKQQDGLQQAAPIKKVVEVETGDLPEDCAPLPLSKPSLRSFSDIDAYHYEQQSRSDLADSDQAASTAPQKRISFRRVAQTVCQFLKAEKRAHKARETRKGQAGKEEKVDWKAVKDFMSEGSRVPANSSRQAGGRDSDRGLKSALKGRPGVESMHAIPRPVPRHGTRLRVEDAHHQGRAQHLVRSHSDETYDDSEPRRRPTHRLQRGHSDSFDDYEVHQGDWLPPRPTPRYSSSHRQDSYRDDTSDCSEGMIHHSSSPDPGYGGRRGSYQYDRSPDRHSHSSFSSQRRHVSFQEQGWERPHRRDRSRDRGRPVRHDGYRRAQQRRDSMDIYEAYRRQQCEDPGQRGPRRPGRQQEVSQRDRHEIYREGLDSDTASDKDSVEHLYISPRYAERLDDHQSPRKSVQFYLGPAEGEARQPGGRGGAHFAANSKSPQCAAEEESLDTQISDGETIIADEYRHDAQYVLHEPYGDVAAYGQERDSTPPPLPMESGGMLSRFLDTVNHIPFIREDLMDSPVGDRDDLHSGHQPPSEHRHATALCPESHGEDRAVGSEGRAVPVGNSAESRRQLHPHTDGRKQGPDTSTPRIGGLVDDDTTTSESETESESDYESDAEQPPGGHVIILDASKNQATDTKETLRGRAVGDKGHYQDKEDVEHMAVMGRGGKSRKGRQCKSMAMIEVQKTVALDMDERQVKDSGDIMEKTKLAVSTESKSMIPVKEGELVTGDGDGLLPAPSIMATTKGKHSVRVAWELPREPDPQYKLLLFVVNVVGTKFSSEINSDISYECNLVEKGKQVRGVQHCWNIQDKQQCVIKGLQPGLTYRIYVICNYSTMRGNKPCEIQTTSSVLYYTTLGPPKAPRLRVVRVDLYQTCLAWEAPAMHENARLSGYQILVDGKPLGGLRNPDIEQMVINNLVPGKTISINVVAVMARAAQESNPSKTIHITCPRRPPAPTISQQPSYKRGCVLLAWDKPRGHPDTSEETISAYSIFVDGQWHGEVKASRMGDQQGYQFFLTDLAPEQSYDVSVKAIAGERSSDPDSQHVHCLSESFMSNVVPVMAPAAPKSPKLRLEGLHPDGIDVTWQTPQQSGDAHISGYQMLKNGKLYGSIIPPDVSSLRIRDVSLGEKLTLQLIALTEHPVGKSELRAGSVAGDKDSGISGSTAQQDDRSAVTSPSSTKESQRVITFTRHIRVNDWPTSESDVFAGERYSGCKPGPKLVVHYTGLVCPPAEVWCERVTGHSALIVWSKAEESKAHYVSADSYQVTWWPGDRPHDEINSDSTTDDHLLITSLRPAVTYTVVVEARKMEKYTDMDEAVSSAETPDGLNAFILSSKSEHLTIKTASPPDPPHNVGVSATTCNSLNVAWDPPLEHGSEVIAIRIECISLNAQDPHHVTEDIMPDCTSADITGLHEKTDYLVRVVAVTEEYFDRLPDKHKHKKLHAIPRDVLVAQEESPWLPSASIIAKTAGTEAPANIRLSKSTMTSFVLTWTPPLVYGSNKLLSQIVRWRDVRRTKPTDPEDLIVASHVNLLPTEDMLTISDLVPGSQYQVVIEAVVSIKTSLNPDQWDSGIEKFRRTAHVMSKPLVVWTRAPIEPPKVLVQSYDQSSALLYWEKPILMSIIGKDEEGNPRYLRRYLEGYRLEINGKLQSCLGPQAQTCTLTKCKPGKQYNVVLVAMTCTEDRRRERKEKFKGYFKTTAPQDTDYVGLLDDDLLDQAPSEPVEISLPKSQDGFLETVRTSFNHQEERDSRTFGDVEVAWTIQGQSNLLKQFSIIWFSSEDRVIQTKYVGPEKRRATIPVTHLKSIYTVTVEPCYYTDVLPQQPQDVHIMIPGPPDAPEIFLRSQDKDEFVIEWGEPRCYGGVKVKGYRVFMNDKKVGNELNNSHRKAVIPCRMNKVYHINLVALSSNPDYQDSPKSNTLVINSGKGAVQGHLSVDEYSADDHDLPVKVTEVTDSGIHLDWSSYVENQDVAFYKIQWSSVAQPAQREVRLSPKDISCVINKCLPGTTHFVRLVAYNEDGQIIEKSKQLTVQTSAPPDAPVLSVRACNFRYIAIQWEKPTTYGDALITGYKVYVNGIVEAVLSADSLSYTFTQGKWCQEYSFQVQALTAGDHLNSKPSEPMVMTWPGIRAPQLRRIPSVSSSSLRVSWTAPYLTDGVKVKHFRLCCVEEDTEKMVQSIGPIHPDSCEAEFKHLKKGSYTIYLETHLYGTGEIVRSDPIRMQPSVCPDPPQISVTIVGLEERRQLEKLTCDLANKRDRLIRAVGHKLKRIGALAHPLRAEKDEDVVMGAHTLTGVEELLESCFQALENYTGQLIAHVSWQCPQTNEDVHLSGFKVLVDGKQYGSSMHSGVRTVRLQLGLEQPSYSLSMVALSDRPQGSSVESTVVDLLTAPFHPFSYYCYHNIHSKGQKWPSQGCCKYQDALSYERQVGKKLANQGLLTKHVPPPACSLLDIFGGDYKPLMSGHRPSCATVLLFWTPWCLSSQKVMDHYVRFAREASKEFNFLAVACGVSGVAADDRQELVHQLTSGGWREDGVMWHCTSECASNVYRTLSTINQTTSSLRVEPDMLSEKYMDLTELLGIAGVPTFLFIHPEGYIAWHGRYSAYDYPAFSAFMRHTNSEVMRHPCPVFNCDCCKNDMSIDQEALGALLPEKIRSTGQAIAIKTASSPNNSETNLSSAAASRTDLKYAAINGFTENASGTDRVFMARKPSPKRRPKLSINRRPYSASATSQQLQGSPYLAKVVPAASTPARSRNRPVSAKLVHYM